MSAIQKYKDYMRVLDVRPGDDAATVKKAFRDRIKKHHPDSATNPEDADHARLLIEAYSSFKKGVPVVKERESSRQPKPEPGSHSEGGLYNRANAYRRKGGKARAVTSEEIGRMAGERIFASIFNRDKPENSEPAPSVFKEGHLEGIWGNLSEMLWGDDPKTHVYGEHAEVREFRPEPNRTPRHTGHRSSQQPFPAGTASATQTNRQNAAAAEEAIQFDQSQFYDQDHYRNSREDLLRAEENLRDVVAYFNERQARFTRSWMQRYIPALTQVQVLFRDVSRRHPAFSGRALRRVRQINELIVEIKQSVR